VSEARGASNFIEEFIEQDLASGRYDRVKTRFPPEPNGFLHIGHAKALCIDFGTAQKYGGTCNLRFDDTNPAKEDAVFVENIERDIRWLGYRWDELHFASDFFPKLFEIACGLIQKGVAYVDDQTPEEMRLSRGTLTTPGVESPFRNRSAEENLDLFHRMRAGEFPDGARVLRAKIDMASPNVLMRDPTLYRILRHHHHRTGDAWCIYPMYDFQHPLQDALEGVTHSLCSLEYEIHRPLYDWVVREAGFERPPRQIEFARLNLTRTIMSKRYLRRLVEEGVVSGWDDPRMPTLAAMRRRGYPPEAISDFLSRVGVSKADSTVDGALLEHCVREALGEGAPRAMAVLDPVEVVLTNWPEGRVEEIRMENHPDHPEMGDRTLRFSGRLFIEREDFLEDPPPKFFRLAPGREARLKGGYIVRCEGLEKDDSGSVVKLFCSVDMDSKSGSAGAGRKVKATLHWLSAEDAVPFTARLYEPILMEDAPQEEIELDEEGAEVERPARDFMDRLNPESLALRDRALCEKAVAEAPVGARFQFLRVGYFAKDPDSTAERPVYNRVVPLKDAWQKAKKG